MTALIKHPLPTPAARNVKNAPIANGRLWKKPAALNPLVAVEKSLIQPVNANLVGLILRLSLLKAIPKNACTVPAGIYLALGAANAPKISLP